MFIKRSTSNPQTAVSSRRELSRLRPLATLLAASLLLILAASAFAGTDKKAAVTVNVTAPTVFKLVSSSFSLPVTVSDTTGAGIVSWQFDLLYNPSVITPQAVPIDTAGTLGSGLFVTYNPVSPGLLKVVFFGVVPISGAGTLFNFKFTAVGSAGNSTPLTWQNFMFNEGNPANVAANGSVTLFSTTAAGAAVSGRVTDSLGRALSGVRLMLSGGSGQPIYAQTGSFGYFVFDGVPAGGTYVLSAEAKQHSFAPLVLSVSEDVSGIDITAEPDQQN